MGNKSVCDLGYRHFDREIRSNPKPNPTAAAAAKSLQSCPTPCDPVDRSLLGSSAHGISQARILEWVAMPSSGGYSRARD